jgi:hypothetical protein
VSLAVVLQHVFEEVADIGLTRVFQAMCILSRSVSTLLVCADFELSIIGAEIVFQTLAASEFACPPAEGAVKQSRTVSLAPRVISVAFPVRSENVSLDLVRRKPECFPSLAPHHEQASAARGSHQFEVV